MKIFFKNKIDKETQPEYNIQGLIETLENFNKWRRGAEMPMPNPTAIGIAIDDAIEILKQYKKLKKYEEI